MTEETGTVLNAAVTAAEGTGDGQVAAGEGGTGEGTGEGEGTAKATEGAAAEGGEKSGEGAGKETAPKGDGKGEKEGNKSGAEGDGENANDAPEQYADFTMPEGVVLDPALVEKFSPIAKELNLSQDQAQSLVDLQTETLKAEKVKGDKLWDDTQAEWKAAGETDAEFGGEKYDENVGLAARAIKQFGNAEFNTMLLATGTGNHPEMIRFLWNIGKLIADDKILIGGGGAKDGKTVAQRLYSKTDMKP